MKACDLMTSHQVWVAADDTDVRHVAGMMAEHNVGAIPVLDNDGRLEGIITDRDIACRVVSKGLSFETPVRKVMTADVKTVRPDTDLDEIERIMQENHIRRLPVVDSENRLQGFISVGDLMHHCHGISYEHGLCELMDAVSAR
ncbi:MAG TPA: CBS domain-containing protein [Phycisphaerae bacterium]|nr:CBS domain-containing protein [Phycisphaerae bacterium]